MNFENLEKFCPLCSISNVFFMPHEKTHTTPHKSTVLVLKSALPLESFSTRTLKDWVQTQEWDTPTFLERSAGKLSVQGGVDVTCFLSR